MPTPRKSAPRAAAAPEAPAAAELAAPAPAPVKAKEKVAAEAEAAPAAFAGLDPTAVIDGAMTQMTEAREILRQASAASLEQGRAAYARLKDAAEELSASIESAYKASGEGAEALRVKAVDAIKLNADAGFEYARAAAAAKTLPDLVTLQADFARKQTEIFGAQAREFASLAEKVANDALAPFKSAFGKGFGAVA
jgi:phasin